MLRHVGKIKTTDTRCVVVMMQIPGKDDHSLIIETDSLPDHYHQHVMDCLESKEGQSAESFATELSRRFIFIADKGNLTILQALHEARFLRPVLIDHIIMVPAPGMAFPLRQILQSMGKAVPVTEDTVLDPNKFNPHAHNAQVGSAQDKINTAKGILTQAQLMERDAARMREQAYALAPELRTTLPPPTQIVLEKDEMEEPKRPRGRPKKVASND